MRFKIYFAAIVSALLLSGCVIPVASSDKVTLEKIRAIDRLADKNPELAIAGYIAMDPRGAIVTMINSGGGRSVDQIVDSKDKSIEETDKTTDAASEEDLQMEFEAWKKSVLKD